jgi:pentatricopeptide repeat protein
LNTYKVLINQLSQQGRPDEIFQLLNYLRSKNFNIPPETLVIVMSACNRNGLHDIVIKIRNSQPLSKLLISPPIHLQFEVATTIAYCGMKDWRGAVSCLAQALQYRLPVDEKLIVPVLYACSMAADNEVIPAAEIAERIFLDHYKSEKRELISFTSVAYVVLSLQRANRYSDAFDLFVLFCNALKSPPTWINESYIYRGKMIVDIDLSQMQPLLYFPAIQYALALQHRSYILSKFYIILI